MPGLDNRAVKWVRSLAAPAAGFSVKKEDVDSSLWYLLSGGRRNAPVQPLCAQPRKNSPSPKKDITNPPVSEWETEASSNFTYYVTGDKVSAPEEPTPLEKAIMAEQNRLHEIEAKEEADKTAEVERLAAEEAAKNPVVPKKNRRKSMKGNKTSSEPVETVEADAKQKKRSGYGKVKRKVRKKTKSKPIPPRPEFFPYGMNDIVERKTFNVKTERKSEIYKTALRAHKQRQGHLEEVKKTKEEKTEDIIRLKRMDTVTRLTDGKGNKLSKKDLKYMKPPPLPLPTPSRAGYMPRMISNPEPEPDIGIENLLMWPSEDRPAWPENKTKRETSASVVESLMRENQVGWEDLPAAGKSSGVVQSNCSPRSPDKALLKAYKRTPNFEGPRVSDPKENEISEAVETTAVKLARFKTNATAGMNPRNFGHLPSKWTKFIKAAGNVRKAKEPGVADLLGGGV